MISIYNLVVETTQKCNLNCSHCLRGSTRNVNLNSNLLRVFLRSIDSVGSLTIGGGEPALAIDEIEEVRYAFYDAQCELQNAYLVTNGLYKTLELAQAFERLESVCSDRSISAFTFSFDHWHNEAVIESGRKDRRQYNYWEADEFLSLAGITVNKHSDESWDFGSIIKMGRAINTGAREITPELIQWYDDDDDINIYEGEIYFNAKGEIYSNCNLSYKEMTPKSDFFICYYNDYFEEKLVEYNNRVKEKYNIIEYCNE